MIPDFGGPGLRFPSAGGAAGEDKSEFFCFFAAGDRKPDFIGDDPSAETLSYGFLQHVGKNARLQAGGI